MTQRTLQCIWLFPFRIVLSFGQQTSARIGRTSDEPIEFARVVYFSPSERVGITDVNGRLLMDSTDRVICSDLCRLQDSFRND